MFPTVRSSLGRFRGDLDSAVDRLFRGISDRNGEELAPFLGETTPKVEMEENDGEIVVRAEMPGLEKDDFEVELVNNRLTIRGEKRYSTEKKERNLHYTEISYGSFSRSFTLPSEIESDKIDAKYENGILIIRLPKSEKAKSKKVKVNVT